MVTVNQVMWGKYKGFSGPYYKGMFRYELPENPSENDKRLRVCTSTEGGTYDAVNMYDRCIISVGLIQCCEAKYFLTSRLLHHVCETVSPDVVIKALRPALQLTNAEFKKNENEQWRFFQGGMEIKTEKQQQELFLGCDGKDGSWTPESTNRA